MVPKHKPISVLIIIDAWFPFTGGGQIHVLELSSALSRLYHCQIHLLYPRSARLPYRLIWTLIAPIIALFRFRDHRLDIIHSHGILPGLTGKLISLLTRLPQIHTVHGSHLMDTNLSTLAASVERFILTQIRYTRQITVAANFLTYPNINSHPAHIRNGVDLLAFDSIRSPKPKRPVLLCVARDHPHKGLNYLRRAFTTLRRRFPDLTLHIISGGLSGIHLIKAYKSASIFILPSLAEGQPIVLLEAWAARLPIIATRVGDNPSLIQPNKNGLLINPGQEDQIVSAVSKLLANPPLARRLGQKGYQTVKAQYTWDHVATATHQIYQEVLQSSHRPIN